MPPAPRAIQQDFAITLPWMTAELRAGRTVVLQRLPDDLPPQAETERAFVAASGMLSAIVVPLGAGDDLLGGLAVSTFSAARVWPRRLVARVELLASVLANAMHRRASALKIQELTERLAAENVYLQRVARRADGFDEIVGSSAGIASVLRQIEQVASTDAPVLILGETGTGKELVARALHNRSRRGSRPFVAINCAALPPALIESELFGHEKGAFTGAVSRMIGRFEIAAGGTLFLDEIGDLPCELQAKLLRVLQTGSFERVGSARSIAADVRVLAATHRDLSRAVQEGRFREDLYYRVGVFPIRVPPLREHLDDLPLLVWHTIARRQRDLGKTIERVPDAMLRAFSNYDWPGNVRELENVIERAMIVTTGPTLAWNASFLAGLRVARSCSGETPGGDRARPHRGRARRVRLQDRGTRQRGGAPGAQALDVTGAHEEARASSVRGAERMDRCAVRATFTSRIRSGDPMRAVRRAAAVLGSVLLSPHSPPRRPRRRSRPTSSCCTTATASPARCGSSSAAASPTRPTTWERSPSSGSRWRSSPRRRTTRSRPRTPAASWGASSRSAPRPWSWSVDPDLHVVGIEEVVRITRLDAGFWRRLEGSFDLGLSYTQADSTAQFNFDFEAEQRRPNRQTSIDMSAILTNRDIDSEDDDDSTRRYDATLSHLRLRKSRWFSQFFGGAQGNEELGLDLRAFAGAGYGRTAIQTNRTILRGSAALVAVEEWSTEGANEEEIEAALIGTYSFFTFDYPNTKVERTARGVPRTLQRRRPATGGQLLGATRALEGPLRERQRLRELRPGSSRGRCRTERLGLHHLDRVELLRCANIWALPK